MLELVLRLLLLLLLMTQIIDLISPLPVKLGLVHQVLLQLKVVVTLPIVLTLLSILESLHQLLCLRLTILLVHREES